MTDTLRGLGRCPGADDDGPGTHGTHDTYDGHDAYGTHDGDREDHADDVRGDVAGLWGTPWDLVERSAGPSSWLPSPRPAQDVTPPVLVGLDEGTGGGLALEWALRHACDLGAPVRAVTAWAWDARVLHGGRLADRVRAAQEAQLDRVLRRLGPAHCRIETVLGEGDPASLLLEQSRTARLLVVGSHAEPGRPSVGSVARACLRFAQCPVVVVPVRAVA